MRDISLLRVLLLLSLLLPLAAAAQNGPGGLGISLVTDGTTTVTNTRQMVFTGGGATVASGGTGTGIVNVAITGGITIGAPISGVCTNGFVLFNNSGVLGCESVSGTGTVTSITAATPGSTLTLSGTNPITTAGTINFDLNLTHANNWTAQQTFTGGVGVTPTTNPLVINGNTGTPPVPPAGSMVQMVGADGVAVAINGFSYGAAFLYQGFRAGGTEASPTAVLLNDALVNISGSGFDGVNYGGVVPGDMVLLAAENYTATAHGNYFRWRVTANGTLTKTEAMRIQNNGTLSIGATGLTGSSKLQVTGGTLTDTLNASGAITLTGLTTGSQVSCMGLTSGNLVALSTGACGSGGSGLTVGTSTITSGTTTRVLFDNSGVLGEYTISGTGNVAMTTSPTFVTPALGTPASGVGTNLTGIPISTGVSGLGTGVATAAANAVNTSGGLLTSAVADGQTIVFASNKLSTSAADRTSVISATILATDMGGQVNFNGSSLTVTIPAVSSTVFAAGMTATICNYASSTLTISTTPTINGYTPSTIPATSGGIASCLALTSNGTSLDAIPTSGGGGGGSGTVNSGTVGQIAVYAGSGTTISGQTVASGVILKGQGAAVPVASAISDNGSVTSIAEGALTTPFGLTDGASIAVNAFLSNNFTVTLAGNRTLANPTNTTAGQWLDFVITQDGTGSRTLAFGAGYLNSSGAAFTASLNSAAGAVTEIACKIITTAPTLICYGPSTTVVTGSNCSSGASPAVCASASAGSVAVPTGTNPTLVVNTTAVTANSQILLNVDESLGTKLSVTCNTTLTTLVNPVVTARTAGTSFTVQMGAVITVNPACVSYVVIN